MNRELWCQFMTLTDTLTNQHQQPLKSWGLGIWEEFEVSNCNSVKSPFAYPINSAASFFFFFLPQLLRNLQLSKNRSAYISGFFFHQNNNFCLWIYLIALDWKNSELNSYHLTEIFQGNIRVSSNNKITVSRLHKASPLPLCSMPCMYSTVWVCCISEAYRSAHSPDTPLDDSTV